MAPLAWPEVRSPEGELRIVVRPRATLFFDAAALDAKVVLAAAGQLEALRPAWRIAFVRSGGDREWSKVGDRPLADLVADPAGHWKLALADARRDGGCRMEATRAPAWRGEPLIATLRVDFPDNVQPSELTAFMVRAAERLPVLWGSAGLAFERAPSWGFLLDDEPMRALAKRYWAVQVLDPVLLLRDARFGLPSVGWLTLMSAGFAGTRGIGLDALAERCATTATSGLFHRRAPNALVVAAGPRPILGDVNLDEDLTAHAAVDALLAPWRTIEPDPAAGRLRRHERYVAWLGRYGEPVRWFDAD